MRVSKINIPVVFRVKPKEVEFDAREFGIQLASDDCDKQAAILVWWAEEIKSWESRHSWDMQCRMIAESMDNEQCAAVRLMLDTLNVHLEAIPRERTKPTTSDEVPS